MWRIGELELIKRSQEYQMRTTNTGPRRPLQMNVAGMHTPSMDRHVSADQASRHSKTTLVRF